ncbi:terminase small subunit [Gallibacterium genomosp. 3]|uniref:terminase small subunit n=1 Tax=Gallibacterium genomosp. 3 TaxID=505345 RepID=UPI00080269BC|nr:terminase small subunit [Gallibacterium genomosp. 3]
MNNLTPKQEKFCQLYIELSNASEAYRKVYNVENMKSSTVNRKASELLDNGMITARINELRANHKQRHNITIDNLLGELEEARTIAKEKGNANAMINATMGKAKMLGFDKPVMETKEEKDFKEFAQWLNEIDLGIYKQ